MGIKRFGINMSFDPGNPQDPHSDEHNGEHPSQDPFYDHDPSHSHKPIKEFGWGAKIAIRIFFLFLLIVAAAWTALSAVFFVVSFVLSLLTLFLCKPIKAAFLTHYSYLKRGIVSTIGCAFALLSPGLGIAIVLAYFVTDSAHNQRGFQRYVHSNLTRYSDFLKRGGSGPAT